MHTWMVNYVNLNHNIFVNISKGHDDLLEIEIKVFQMKIKKEINVPLMQDYIHNWAEK